MSIVTCPKCKSPNDDAQFAGDAIVCAICANRWMPSAAIIDSLPTTEIPNEKPSPAVKMTTKPLNAAAQRNQGSGEYLPDEPDTDAQGNKALTGRVDGRQSGLAPAIREGVQASLAPVLNAPPAQQSPPHKAAERQESGGDRPAIDVRKPQAAQASEPAQTMDSDLFDRLEEQAQYNRSQMKTVPEIVFDDPAKYRTALPHSDQSEKVCCPVCGHTYAATGQHHTCPQCGTVYDEDSQRITVGLGVKDNLIGRSLRGCLIDRKLGEGGMGTVYHAKQLSLDRSVAVKVLPVDLARNKNFIQRFEREAKSLARINHPNILQIYDFGDDPSLGLYFMIIEYVEGLDLGEVLNRRGLLGQIEVLDLLRQAVSGLEAAAEKGVIHRDIKPDNLMIGSNGLVKVSDFGLAKGYVAQVGVTAAGVRVGTPAFMSPEQCDGVEVDFRSDIYNLGATAFLCLTGRLPFDGETPFAIMLKHKTEAVPSLSAIDPTIDRQVDELIGRMLAKKPEDRCVTLRELGEAIEELEARLAGTDSILRKSRGPFRALMGGAPPMPVPGKSRSPLMNAAPLPVHEQVEVVDFPPPLPTPTAAPPRAASGPLRQADIPLPLPPTPLEVAPAPVVERTSPRPSRRMDAELSQARERGRRSQFEVALANALRLERAGRWLEASAALFAVADLAEADQQAQYRGRAQSARRRARAMRIIRRTTLVAIGLGLLGATIWAGTPRLHNLVAEKRYQSLSATLTTYAQTKPQIELLKDFVQTYGEPFAWYQAVFSQTYTVDVIPEAQTQIAHLEAKVTAEKPVVTQSAVLAPEIATILAQANDPKSSWETIERKTADLLAKAQQLQQNPAALAAVRDKNKQAASELAAQAEDVRQIQAARVAGEHVRALQLAADFRARHPRADVNARSLPFPARIQVNLVGVAIPPDLRCQVDGQVVKLGPIVTTNSEMLGLEGVVCRNGEKDTRVEISATGFVSQAERIPGSTALAEKMVGVTLRPAADWSITFANPGALGSLVPWVCLRPVPGALVIQHREGLLAVSTATGAERARNQRLTPTAPVLLPLWLPQAGNRVAVARDDGVVDLIGVPNLITEQHVYAGKGEILGWTPLDLELQNGRRINAAIERQVNGGAVLVAQDAQREYWRYSDQIDARSLPPTIIRHDQRLYVFDDSQLHIIEEQDGKCIKVFALKGKRLSAPGVLPAQGDLPEVLLPMATEIIRLQLGTHAEALHLVRDQALTDVGPGQVVVDGADALIVGERKVSLLHLAQASRLAWSSPLSRPQGAAPTLSGDHIALVDDQGTITVRTRSTGEIVQRIGHGTPAAGPLVITDLPNGPAVMIGDRKGQVTAYQIRR